jgi:carbon monoxide dehydrogenase subunit G
MELTNDFRVGVPIDHAWDVLTDLERIAPCMPGAQLQEIEGEEHRGIVKVKVGPITAQYKGTATMVERDVAARRAVVHASGRETRGQGNASATITATLTDDGGGTAVSVVTDLTITGKVAQLGRGVLADVSANLLDQFVAALERDVLASAADNSTPHKPGAHVEMSTAPHDAPHETAAAQPAVRTVHQPDAKPVDLLETAGTPVAKRVAPIAAIVAVLWLLRLFLRRRGRT